MTRFVISSLAIAFAALLSAPGYADEPAKPAAPAAAGPGAAPAAPAGPRPKWVEVCDADMKRLCKEQMKGDVRPCLYEKLEELAEECGKAMRGYKVAEVCKDDIMKLCAAEAKAGGLGKCLKEKQDQMSKPCKDALVRGSKQAKAADKAEAKAEAKAEVKEAAKEPAPKAEVPKKAAKAKKAAK